MQRLKARIAAATIAAGLACVALPAAAQTYYTINGQPAPYDVALYMAQNGLPAGDYWLDAQGYWGVMGNCAAARQHLPGQLPSRAMAAASRARTAGATTTTCPERGWAATTTVATTPAIGRIADAGATAT